jgi:hypothetical protein
MADGGEEKDPKHGLARTWKVAGFANPEVAKELTSLASKTKVTELIDTIAEKHDASYMTVDSDSRSLSVNFEQKSGAMPSSKAFPTRIARYFRTGFDLTITQSFDSTDELAMNSNIEKEDK